MISGRNTMIESSDILNGKILIVDDLETNILLLKRTLGDAGYSSVTSTTNPNDVMDLHRNNHYDLILLDLEMPNEAFSGFQVMEDLKKIEAENYLPVMVVTAHPEHMLHALESGARDFISKPFILAEVLARVRNMLETRLLHVAANSLIDAMQHELAEVKASRDLLRGERIETGLE
jgi:adenylate cyclase